MFFLVFISLGGLGFWLKIGFCFYYRYATEHRCGVVVKGPRLSGNISGTDPLKDNRLLLEAKPLDESEEANHTAKVVNELSREISRILVCHPLNAERAAQGKNIANLVLLRGCGIRIEVCVSVFYCLVQMLLVNLNCFMYISVTGFVYLGTSFSREARLVALYGSTNKDYSRTWYVSRY